MHYNVFCLDLELLSTRRKSQRNAHVTVGVVRARLCDVHACESASPCTFMCASGMYSRPLEKADADSPMASDICVAMPINGISVCIHKQKIRRWSEHIKQTPSLVSLVYLFVQLTNSFFSRSLGVYLYYVVASALLAPC